LEAAQLRDLPGTGRRESAQFLLPPSPEALQAQTGREKARMRDPCASAALLLPSSPEALKPPTGRGTGRDEG